MRRCIWTCATAAVLALFVAMTATGQTPNGNTPVQTKTGVVRSVDPIAKSIVVVVAREMTFFVTPDTQIVQAGETGTLADIGEGATVTVVYSFTAERDRVASSIALTKEPPPPTTGVDVRVDFTQDTRDPHGAPVRQDRDYWVYRPRGLPRTDHVPMILIMDRWDPELLRRKADRAGFLVVSCGPAKKWLNDDPRICGYQDYDYLTEVIRRVRATENGGDAFVVGLSKGGHTALAYACERPDMVRAAASVDEFMGLTSNRPTAPLPVIVFQGTSDTNVPYAMVKDTVDAWRAVDGLMDAVPVTTYKPSPRAPGSVSQSTWRGGLGGTQVAFVTIVGGGHNYPRPDIQTGYDFSDDLWAFFSQLLTDPPTQPMIVSQPVDNVQRAGQPASFRVVAAGADPVAYQWQRNGEDIPGATQSWFTVSAAAPADNGAAFRAGVRNGAGTVVSDAATLTVTAAPAGPSITAQPESLTVAAGRPARFAVDATGIPPLRYQWRRNGVNIEGATGASYSLPIAVPFDSGASFSVTVADRTGTAFSAPATLGVTRPPGVPVILANPARVRLLAGESGTFSVSAWSASPLRYQWQRGTFTGHMMDIPGATEATYTTPPAALADHLALLRCVVSNATGSVASASEMLFVTAQPKAPSEITSPITAVAQTGVPFRYTIASSGGTPPLTYTAAPLPLGLSVDSGTGELSGTPTQTGNTRIVVSADNSAGRVSATLVLTVAATPPSISLDSWKADHFGASAGDPAIAGDTADPDGDGLSNIEEFNRKSDPLG